MTAYLAHRRGNLVLACHWTRGPLLPCPTTVSLDLDYILLISGVDWQCGFDCAEPRLNSVSHTALRNIQESVSIPIGGIGWVMLTLEVWVSGERILKKTYNCILMKRRDQGFIWKFFLKIGCIYSLSF